MNCKYTCYTVYHIAFARFAANIWGGGKWLDKTDVLES